ncbi:hypothetical protein E0765_07350 [Sulfuricurvum sp. IAE1]|uniref:TraE/TraK family type IV conjugative transfer system protein n=1 Tax=Sulfuricurvum sp. IAE1 TaxID=2546102 RepID=UPI00104A87D6|nr:TraE/TraK family type IV conjugative transfer system protein [Sulfuricurvum sp. IAE1]TDA63643.1 hypothetical protein E0765_07350 [Sulfuricurvum sp. IAE1]
MKSSFWSNWAKLDSENAVLKIALLAVSGSLVVSLLVIKSVTEDKTVVVIPPNFQKEFRVTGNKISYEYFEQVGFYVSDRLLSVSPQNVQASFDSIMPFLTKDPRAVKAIRENLALQATVIKENDIYQAFYPMKVMVNDIGTKFSVEGTLKKMSGNNAISTARTTIVYDFIVQDGQLIITSIEVQ